MITTTTKLSGLPAWYRKVCLVITDSEKVNTHTHAYTHTHTHTHTGKKTFPTHSLYKQSNNRLTVALFEGL
jgi:hypothetical protein